MLIEKYLDKCWKCLVVVFTESIRSIYACVPISTQLPFVSRFPSTIFCLLLQSLSQNLLFFHRFSLRFHISLSHPVPSPQLMVCNCLIDCLSCLTLALLQRVINKSQTIFECLQQHAQHVNIACSSMLSVIILPVVACLVC